MPSGVKHTQFTVSIITPAAGITGLAGGALLGDPILGAAGATIGALSGIPISPDIDQMIIDHTEHLMLKWSGVFFLSTFVGMWIGFWYSPYAAFFPHRSKATHLPGLGTLIRVLYMAWNPAALVICALLGLDFSSMLFWPVALMGWKLFLFWFYGLTLADFGHWALDGFPMGPGDTGIWNKTKKAKRTISIVGASNQRPSAFDKW